MIKRPKERKYKFKKGFQLPKEGEGHKLGLGEVTSLDNPFVAMYADTIVDKGIDPRSLIVPFVIFPTCGGMIIGLGCIYRGDNGKLALSLVPIQIDQIRGHKAMFIARGMTDRISDAIKSHFASYCKSLEAQQN